MADVANATTDAAMDTTEDTASAPAAEPASPAAAAKDQEEEEEEEEGGKDKPDRPRRERKSVGRFQAAPSPVKKTAFSVEVGAGTPLRDNPNVDYHINKHKAEELKLVHRLLFGFPGKQRDVKNHIREFSGYPATMTDGEMEKRRDLCARMYLPVIKDLCTKLDIAASGKKDDMVDAVLAWCKNPQPSGKKGHQAVRAEKRDKAAKQAKRKAAKRKRKATTKAKSGKAKSKRGPKAAAAAVKAPMTAFQFYAKKASGDIKASSPKGTSSADLMRLVKKAWKALEEAEKAPFTKKADADAQRYAKAMEALEQVSSSEEEEESEEESEEEAPTPKASPKKTKKQTAKPSPKKSKVELSDSSDDEPLVATNGPSQTQLAAAVVKVLSSANLEEVTKKSARNDVQALFPDMDMAQHKAFLNEKIAEYISNL